MISDINYQRYANSTSGDMLNPKKKYNLEYYLSVVEKIVGMGAHILGIKDSEYFPNTLTTMY
jgi:pyruvate carboxylase